MYESARTKFIDKRLYFVSISNEMREGVLKLIISSTILDFQKRRKCEILIEQYNIEVYS